MPFSEGLTVLSGETGAGKSIIINAVNLILGSRATAGLIRTGCEEAELEAFFSVASGTKTEKIMQEKIKAFSINHQGLKKVEEQVASHKYDTRYDYGNLTGLTRFRGTHPAVMEPWIARFNWKEQLRFQGGNIA